MVKLPLIHFLGFAYIILCVSCIISLKLPSSMADFDFYQSIIADHVKVVLDLSFEEVDDFASDIFKTLDRGGKVVFFGNGGSATQASHWAEEFVGRFVKKRKSLPAIALGTNFANVTGIGNDFGFDKVFSREVESLVNKRDLAVAISTSGNSPNVLKALEVANKKGIKTWILTGNTNSRAKKIADRAISVNSTKTARIQELHALVIHMIFELVDEKYS